MSDDEAPPPDTIAAAVLAMLSEEAPGDDPHDLQVLGIFAIAVFAGEDRGISIVTSAAQRPLPGRASPQTATAIRDLWKSVDEHVHREHEAFGIAAGLQRANPRSKGSA